MLAIKFIVLQVAFLEVLRLDYIKVYLNLFTNLEEGILAEHQI